MKVVLAVVGIAAVIGGLLLLTMINERSDPERIAGLAFGLFVSAGVFFVAAAKNYRGHWSFIIGVALLVIAFGGLIAEIESAWDGEGRTAARGAGLIVIFTAFGLLSLWSGHKLHQCTRKLESLTENSTERSSIPTT
jgi:hypothetical protein